MTWVRDPDEVYDAEAMWEADKEAVLLWSVAMRESGRNAGTDGVLSPRLVHASLNKFRTPIKRAAVGELLRLELWHDAAGLKGCGLCLEHSPSLPSDAHYLIHEWWEHQMRADGKTDPIKRARERRRKDLNGPRCFDLRGRVRDRDKDRCRYCGIPCTDSSGPDKKSKSGLTLDHVDPWGENTFENVCVACRRCNGLKGERTPSEAGMIWWPPGTTELEIEMLRQIASGAAPETAGSKPVADLAHARHAREAGTGRVGTGVAGSKPGREPALGQNGSGRD